MLEEDVVEALWHTEDLRQTCQRELGLLREELAGARSRVAKAEARSNLLASAYAVTPAQPAVGPSS
jgi:hypothetical protein